ncbi:MAG: hypothetical protein HY072_06690 [Deltaproteobacteria bacterium]|nr:hypothetical protein [Deltaproteobacteria bacterium]
MTEAGSVVGKYTLMMDGINVVEAKSGTLDSALHHPLLGVVKPYVTIERSVIENLVKIDNDVHIGHNAYVAKGAIICGATALAGNASVGEFSYVGGLTGISNHVHVGAGAKVGALTILTKDVPDGGTAVGVPQRDYQNHFKVHAYLNRMALKKNKTGD